MNKRPWTRDEDNQILKLVNERGPKWAEIAKELPGRTENAVKNRWNAKLSKPEQVESRKLYKTASSNSATSGKSVEHKKILGNELSSNNG